jgi:hypothetical protein
MWGWLAAALLVCGCGKDAGEPCKRGECKDGLVCDGPGDDVCRTCKESVRCTDDGLCEYRDEGCWATAEAHCKASWYCKERGYCTLAAKKGTCVNDGGTTRWSDNKEGGCPCGCDRSEKMVAELAAQGDAKALATARRSLAAIGEREHAGYITEAMVQHRLRLRALEARLDPADEVFRPALSSPARARRDARAKLPAITADELVISQELLVFGATTERVNGRDKDLRPCFTLWLSLRNTGDERRTLAQPELSGSVPFAVKRWYLEDTDGSPWDGILEPGKRRSVMVIGYVDENTAPGTSVRASVEVAGTTSTTTVRALGRWDRALERLDE